LSLLVERFDRNEHSLQVRRDALRPLQKQLPNRARERVGVAFVHNHRVRPKLTAHEVDELHPALQQRASAVAQALALARQLAGHVHRRQVDARGDLAELASVALVVLDAALAHPQLPNQGCGHHPDLVTQRAGRIRDEERLRASLQDHSAVRTSGQVRPELCRRNLPLQQDRPLRVAHTHL
jgi:hypothetical protein